MTNERHPLETLSLQELEESAGELQRLIGVALRLIGEQRADEPHLDGVSPRRRVAGLAVQLELAAVYLGGLMAGVTPSLWRLDRHPGVVAALVYAAPSIAALMSRLEQDRRLLTSLARQLEGDLDIASPSPWGARTPRQVLVEVLIAEPARCAQALEQTQLEA